jgi:hypothetical protein
MAKPSLLGPVSHYFSPVSGADSTPLPTGRLQNLLERRAEGDRYTCRRGSARGGGLRDSIEIGTVTGTLSAFRFARMPAVRTRARELKLRT